VINQKPPKVGTKEYYDMETYLPRCEYMHRLGGGQPHQCTARSVRNGLRFCPEHRCWYHDEGGLQCENGINNKMQCSPHPCRIPGCEVRSAAPSSYCQDEHVMLPCAFVDEYGTRCAKDPRQDSDYCSKRHRSDARKIRRDKRELAENPNPIPTSHPLYQATDPNSIQINPNCKCITDFGLPIRHYLYNVSCYDRVKS